MPKMQNVSRKFGYKLCILGEGSVGKTTLVERLTTGKFNPITKMTIGIDFSMVNVDLEVEPEKKVNIDLQVWDLGGQDRFRFILPSYIQGADGGLLLYDVNWFPSEKNLPDWIDLWYNNTKPGIPIYLVGTKLDMVTQTNLPLVEQRIFELQQYLGIQKHFLISSKDGTMIENTIHSIARDMWTFKNQQSKEEKTEYSFLDALRKT
ncbi:MAG: GTP-binding protein [Promethearchaeota archaeon]|nr:MAG: GTP-binding protein [Candidatus Lokiarchaeota archaeon]